MRPHLRDRLHRSTGALARQLVLERRRYFRSSSVSSSPSLNYLCRNPIHGMLEYYVPVDKNLIRSNSPCAFCAGARCLVGPIPETKKVPGPKTQWSRPVTLR